MSAAATITRISIYIVEAAAALLITNFVYNFFASPIRAFPGPFWAKFTNCWRAWDVYKGHAHETQLKLHEKHGPIVRIGPNIVSINDPAMIEEIYGRTNVLLKSDFYSVNDLVVNGRRVPNIFSTRDEAWNTKVLKPIFKYFSTGTMVKMEPLVDSGIMHFVDHLNKRFAAGPNAGKPCDIANWLNYMGWDLMSEITFSKRFGYLEAGHDFNGMLHGSEQAFDYFSAVGQIPKLDLLLDKNPFIRLGPEVFGPGVQLALDSVAARKAGTDKHSSQATRDFLDLYLEAEANNPDVDTTTVIAYLMVNITAGSDTAAIAIRAALYYLARTPAALSRLRAELDAAQLPVPVSWKATLSCPYLDACIRESVRLHPALGLILERRVPPQGLPLSTGDVLPPGTIVGINPCVVHHNAHVYGANTKAFFPERWLPAPGELPADAEARISQMRSTELAFGHGKRACAGRNVAMFEVYKTVATMVRLYDFELVRPEREWKVRNSFFVRQWDMDMRLRLREGIMHSGLENKTPVA